jgi:hypothetical protein
MNAEFGHKLSERILKDLDIPSPNEGAELTDKQLTKLAIISDLLSTVVAGLFHIHSTDMIKIIGVLHANMKQANEEANLAVDNAKKANLN